MWNLHSLTYISGITVLVYRHLEYKKCTPETVCKSMLTFLQIWFLDGINLIHRYRRGRGFKSVKGRIAILRFQPRDSQSLWTHIRMVNRTNASG